MYGIMRSFCLLSPESLTILSLYSSNISIPGITHVIANVIPMTPNFEFIDTMNSIVIHNTIAIA